MSVSYEQTDQQLEESFAQIHLLAWGLILFWGLIGVLNIINTVYTNIHTRKKEIGTQRAIGMSLKSLYKTFLWEGRIMASLAAVIGGMAGSFLRHGDPRGADGDSYPLERRRGSHFWKQRASLWRSACWPRDSPAPNCTFVIVDAIETVE